MSALGRPGALAALLALLAAVLHPALGTAAWLPGRAVVLAALALASALGLLVAAFPPGSGRLRRALMAAGGLVLVVAGAADGLLGYHGTMDLVAGQARPHFDETGPSGRPLGLRPLNFMVGAERVDPDGTVALDLPNGPVSLLPDRSVSFGGYRFARPRAVTTGDASRLRVAASDGTHTWVADVAPGAPGRAGDVTIALERFFPDFALDEQQQPFSRSSELRNPGALLTVEREGKAYRAFVLQSMPGVHRVEPLGLSFTLLEVEPERVAQIAVVHEPAAPVFLLGALLLAASLALVAHEGVPACEHPALAPLSTAGALLAVLVVSDGGAVLGWSQGVATTSGRAVLPGVGVLLGAALLAALGGSLLLAAQAAGGAGDGVRRVSRGALWAAVLLVGAAVLLAAMRLSPLPPMSAGSLLPLAAIGTAAALLAVSLLAARPAPPPLVSRGLPRALPIGVLAAVVAAAFIGVAAIQREGSYATGATAAATAVVLLGLAALEQTAACGLRRAVFLVALLGLAAA